MNYRLAVCGILGHSNIQRVWFGYHCCGRCGETIGDSLGSIYINPYQVSIGHNCETCYANYAKLSWKDKFMTPNPFKEEI